MIAEEIRRAIERAPRERLPELSSALWKGFAAGAVTEAEAEEISLLIEARKVSNSWKANPAAQSLAEDNQHKIGTVERRKLQRPPVRSQAIERRRRLAASGVMPPALAARFTTGELAVLRIVADEYCTACKCELCLDAIAARAGTSRTLAKNAIKQARRLGLLEVRERRRTGAKSLTNQIRITDKEWLQWLQRGRNGAGRPKGVHSPDTHAKDLSSIDTPAKGPRFVRTPEKVIGGRKLPATDIGYSTRASSGIAAPSKAAGGQGRARGAVR